MHKCNRNSADNLHISKVKPVSIFESLLTNVFSKVQFVVFAAEYIYILNNVFPQKAEGRTFPVLMVLAAGNAASIV